MEENEEITQEKSVDVYDARLTFRKENGNLEVIVKIRYSKKGPLRKETLGQIEIIDKNELHWTKYHGELIAVYHRNEDNNYIDSRHIKVHVSLGQKLEGIFQKVHSLENKSNKTKEY